MNKLTLRFAAVGMTLAIVLATLLLAPAHATAQSHTWRNVPGFGGGHVPKIIF